jgi:serine/threonine-protein kinase
MAISSCGALVEMLSQHKLLAPKDFADVVRASKVPSATPRALARRMLQRGLLTVYQINQLLAGHAKDLVFGPYHVLDRLGQGGQSMVFKARHSEFQWVVALKVIRPGLLVNMEARNQFLQEMEAMARLNHPNIVQFCDADQAADTYYCAMEFVEGTDLGKIVGLSGPLPVAKACDYIRQTALGLQHAHENNLVHRDIKPVNLLLTTLAPEQRHAAPPESLIKILDWGLASLRPPGTALAGGRPEHLTKCIIGTADYLSPEQAKNAHAVDIRADIYSLGCASFFLLAARPPFPGGSLMQKLLRHQNEQPPGLDALRPDVPPALAAIVRRMMAKRPEDRYQTPAAVAMALTPFGRLPSTPVHSTGSAGRLGFPGGHGEPYDDTPLPRALGNIPGFQAPQPTLTGNGSRPGAEEDSTYM